MSIQPNASRHSKFSQTARNLQKRVQSAGFLSSIEPKNYVTGDYVLFSERYDRGYGKEWTLDAFQVGDLKRDDDMVSVSKEGLVQVTFGSEKDKTQVQTETWRAGTSAEHGSGANFDSQKSIRISRKEYEAFKKAACEEIGQEYQPTPKRSNLVMRLGSRAWKTVSGNWKGFALAGLTAASATAFALSAPVIGALAALPVGLAAMYSAVDKLSEVSGGGGGFTSSEQSSVAFEYDIPGPGIMNTERGYGSKIGNTTYYTDGSHSTKIGGTTFNSDGSFSSKIGKTRFDSNGNITLDFT